MPITVQERLDSRGLTVDPKGNSVSRDYWAQSTNLEEDAGDISDAVAYSSPLVYLGFIKKRITSKPQGGGLWYCTVDYGIPDGADFPTSSDQAGENYQLDPPLKFELAFSTTGGTQHVTQSLETVDSIASPAFRGKAPDTKRAIGVSKSGVAGVDIVVPKFEITITREIAWLSMRDIHKIRKCVGCTNREKWNTFEPDEVLFLGCDASPQGNIGTLKNIAKWLLTYHFLIGEHKKDIEITGGGSVIRIKLKKAHDYLWIGYMNDVESTAGVLLQVPAWAKIERLYESKAFAQELGF